MRLFILLALFHAPLCAKEALPELTSADGKQTMRAKPVAVEGDKIRFEKEGGKTFTASPEKFAKQDQKNLREWAAAMGNNAHAALVDRVKKAKTLRVLFIGNSYSFHIPKVFEVLAKSEGKKIEVEQVTNGGWTLGKHAAAQFTLDEIAEGEWDVVVLQEQSIMPATLEQQRSQMMYPAAKKLADAARAANAIPVLFLTWGRKDGDKQNAAVFPNDTFSAMQKRLIVGYKKAAAHAGGAYIVPVGEVWSVLRQMKKDEGLYTKDGSHPAKRGNYLGACVFYNAFYNEKVRKPARDIVDADDICAVATMAHLVSLPYPLRPAQP